MALITEKKAVHKPKEMSIELAKIAEIGNPINMIGILIQKEAFSFKGNASSLDPNNFVLKKATKPPGNTYSSN